MGDKTGISWTDKTWNPWRGCTKIDPGCAHCYMFDQQTRYGQNPNVVTRTKTWGDPIKWQKESARTNLQILVFTCSWSDWFHDAADAWRDEAWEIVRLCPDLTFQILTKRADRIEGNLPSDWGNGYPNVWLGVSVSEKKGLWRTDALRNVPAMVRFVSYEPALGPIHESIKLDGFHWLIYGGESGFNFRKDDDEWARGIRDRCRGSEVAFFYKQASGRFSGARPTIDGETIQEFPQVKLPGPLRKAAE